jgi:TolA-binding protein
VNFGADDGYDLLFALDEAHDIAEIPAQPAYGFPSSIAAGIVAVLIALAYALEIPPQTVEMLILIGTFCTTGDSEAEKDVINHNLVNLDNTSIALVALDNQIHDLEGQINQLLDTRTQTVVTKLNTAQASLDKALQQSIEESLQGGGATAIASYELPASLGGYIDSKPIGVQAIVTNAMSSLQQANQPINPTATSSLTSANNALAAGQYKQAFTYFQAAYQALTK